MEEMLRIPTVIYRGGTSKAVFLKENDLPSDQSVRNRVINAIFGSPDKRQIDGLGGADPLTSKLAIIGPPSRPDADVDYTFGQVDILSTNINLRGVCGNISAAVGPFAIDEGLVRPQGELTRVRINCTNIGRIIEATVPTEGNRVKVSGDFAIDGVPGTSARIELNWADAVGANTGKLLPTGNAQDNLEVEGVGTVTASIVDVGNPGVFVKAEDLGLKGNETPEEVDSDTELIKRCDAIAAAAAKLIGTPFTLLTYVSGPQDYVNHVTGETMKAEQADYLVRMIFMGQMHKAYAASMINCCGTAAMVPGTVVNEVSSAQDAGQVTVRMGHPAGVADLAISVEKTDEGVKVPSISVYRTARRLMEGHCFVRREVLEGE